MNRSLVILIGIFIIGTILFCGCLSNTPYNTSTSRGSLVSTSGQTEPSGGGQDTAVPGTISTQEGTEPVQSGMNRTVQNGIQEVPVSSRTINMDDFIKLSFSQITELYVSIKKSRDALEWKEVQDDALQLQLLIQEMKTTYRLTVPNPEKTTFGALDSRKEIVLLKYIEYLNDMENYAINLKNAVYYKEKGTDSQSAQNALRYQGQADQYLKQAIAEVKTINDYCNDFKYSFFDTKLVQEYRYIDTS